MSPGISHRTCRAAYARFTPSKSEQRSPPLVPAGSPTRTLSAISPPFGRLSRAEGQITHALLTRSPLYSSRCRDFLARLACVRHAASVRSEPGSNSPNWNVRGSEPQAGFSLQSHLLWLISSATKSVATIFYCQRASIEADWLRCVLKPLNKYTTKCVKRQWDNGIESREFVYNRAPHDCQVFFGG